MIFIIVISFILDNTLSLFTNQSSLFLPLFTLLSLIVIFSYNLKDYHYFIISGSLGLLYDIIFTDSLFLNCGIFLLFSLIIHLIFKRINYNLFNQLLFSLLLILLYRIITYILL